MEVINIDDSDEEHSNNNVPAPPVVNVNNIQNDDDYEYRIMLLMDHREFGMRRNRDNRTYLREVESRLNRYFNGTVCEIVSLKAADYLFTCRKISNITGQVVEERLFDLIIERKDVGDLAQCLIQKSLDYKPLSFFQAQMHKLVNCGIERKMFVIEGDEDKHRWRTEGGGPASQAEQRKRRLRIKTTRLLVERGRFNGVELLCTKFKDRTIQYLIYEMERLRSSFNRRDYASMKTMQQFTDHIKERMNDPTFQKYLSLRRQPRIGDKKAMRVIMDPNEDWDKSFVSPAEKHEDIRANENDRPTFWSRSLARRQDDNDDDAQQRPPPPGAGPPPPAAPPGDGNPGAGGGAGPPQPPLPPQQPPPPNADPPPPPAAAPAGNGRSNAASSNRSSDINRSASNASSRSSNSSTSSNGSQNNNGAASSASSNGASNGRSNTRKGGEESEGKKRDSSLKKTSYKKRQKVNEKLYIRRNPSDLKPSYPAPKESVAISRNEFISTNPLHQTTTSLVAALLDERKPAAKSKRNSQTQRGSKSGSGDYQYMLEFSEDDIEGQVVAVPTPKGKQTTKCGEEEGVALAGRKSQSNDDVASRPKSATESSWYDDYKDVLESSDDDSVTSVNSQAKAIEEIKQRRMGKSTKNVNENDVIVIDDEDDTKSAASVIELLD